MTGLEKIIGRIIGDAQNEAEEIRKKAKEEAARILKEEAESLEELKKEAAEKEAADRQSLEQRAESAAALKKRQVLLAAKQDIINGLIEKAHKSLLEMDEEKYFSLLEAMAGRFSLPKDGEIHVSEKDLKRLPEDFEERIGKAAGKNGGSLKLSLKPAAVDGGFVLSYGGVEENCSFAALFAAKRDELSDRVCGLLFAGERVSSDGSEADRGRAE